ncbi:MAG: FAD binding domain-containing protein [Butyricicoccus sp.]
MLTIGNYVRAKSLEEAYTLCQKKNTIVLGGMLWLKMQHRTVGTAVDLCDLGLDTIEETETEYRIGAMVTLRTLEQHKALNALTQGAMADAVKDIVGVQFRNVATVGGSIFGRFGFSDVLTLFLALDAKVELYHAGVLSLRDFAAMPHQRDILVRVIVPKEQGAVVYRAQRNISTDFPVLTCALSVKDRRLLCAIGARPMPANVLETELPCALSEMTEPQANELAEHIAGQFTMGSNLRGSAEYRRVIGGVLVRRALLAAKEAD